MHAEQLITIPDRVTRFDVVCERCVAEEGSADWRGATFTGRLDLDLDEGSFLCRNGHIVHVRRAFATGGPAAAAA